MHQLDHNSQTTDREHINKTPSKILWSQLWWYHESNLSFAEGDTVLSPESPWGDLLCQPRKETPATVRSLLLPCHRSSFRNRELALGGADLERQGRREDSTTREQRQDTKGVWMSGSWLWGTSRKGGFREEAENRSMPRITDPMSFMFVKRQKWNFSWVLLDGTMWVVDERRLFVKHRASLLRWKWITRSHTAPYHQHTKVPWGPSPKARSNTQAVMIPLGKYTRTS